MPLTCRYHIIFLSIFILVAAGCASVQANNCAPDEKPSVSDLMYFGTAKPGGVITPEQWAEFLKKSVNPRFPGGFTVWKASGQWKNADGKIMQEDSFALSIVHQDDRVSEENIRSIIREYKSQFGQEAVVRVRTHVCASF